MIAGIDGLRRAGLLLGIADDEPTERRALAVAATEFRVASRYYHYWPLGLQSKAAGVQQCLLACRNLDEAIEQMSDAEAEELRNALSLFVAFATWLSESCPPATRLSRRTSLPDGGILNRRALLAEAGLEAARPI